MGVDGGGALLAGPEQPSHRDQPDAVRDALSKTVRPRLPFTCSLKVRRSVRSLMVAWMRMGVLPMCSLERLSAGRRPANGRTFSPRWRATIPGRRQTAVVLTAIWIRTGQVRSRMALRLRRSHSTPLLRETVWRALPDSRASHQSRLPEREAIAPACPSSVITRSVSQSDLTSP